MSLRPVELAQVAAELEERLAGAVVQKAWCPLPRLTYLELRVPGRSVLLCLCAEGEVARVGLAAERFPTPGEPAPLQRWLRQELVGWRLSGVLWGEAERTVVLGFERQGARRRLVLELAPPGGLVLLSESGRVLALSGEGLAARRGLHPGGEWQPPPAQGAQELERARAAPSRLVPEPEAFAPYAEAAERLLGTRDRRVRVESIRRRLAQPWRARLKRAARTLEKVQAEGARGPEAERHRRLGELLLQNLHRVPRGSREVVLTSYTEEGMEEVRVALDPRRTPKEEAEWHFHQYRRLTRGVEHARHREAELAREVAHARAALAQLEAMEEEALLAQVEVLHQGGAEEGPPRALPYKEYVGHGGQRLWVGRGSEDNDTLTFRIARPHHLWLHARGQPGSHVVVPLEKGAQVHPEALLDAAHLALHHSGAKGEPRGEVSWVPVRHVRKVKGGAPGQVLYSQERTLLVRVEPERLKRLLASRQGEAPPEP